MRVSQTELRRALVVIGVLALASTSCARIPTAEDANNAVLSLRGWGSWAWALGVGLIWADRVLPIPQTAVIAALGIIYGSLLGGLLGSLGLISSGLVGYLLMLTSHGDLYSASLGASRCAGWRAYSSAAVPGRSW